MAPARVPFGRIVEPGDVGEAYDPGAVLALALAEGPPEQGRPRDLETPWGSLRVESKPDGVLLAATPAAHVAVPRILTAMVSMKLGLARGRVDATGLSIQVLDVGRPVLVVPLPDAEDITSLPEEASLEDLPGVSAHQAVVYARTQRTPYVKLLGRVWGEGELLAAAAAAAVHQVVGGGVRATYPRTRVVVELVGHEGRAEVSLVLKSKGGAPSVERLFVGGRVEPGKD